MRRASTAGSAPLAGRLSPIASTKLDIVEAVPIVIQTPLDLLIPLSAAINSDSDMSPARTASENFHTSVPEPISFPCHLPLSIGPELTTIVGRSTEAAPIS